MKKIFSLLIIVIALVGCGKDKNNYYALHHYTELEDNEGKRLNFIDWGEPLLEIKEEKATKKDSIKVKVISTEQVGFVKEKSLIKDIVSKAILMKEKTVYRIPSIHSRESAIANYPMLCFITQIKETEKQGKWAEVVFYNASEQFNLKNPMNKLYGKYWIKLDELSTNQSDVQIVKSVQLALSQYRWAKKNRKDYSSEVKRLKKVLENIINTYTERDAIVFAQEARDMIGGQDKEEPVKDEKEEEMKKEDGSKEETIIPDSEAGEK